MIELRKVYKSYQSQLVIKNLNLTIPDHQVTMLLGPSGCGKTTTLELINGLRTPDSGEIRIHNKNIREWDIIQLRRQMGYVIQEIGLFPHYTVYQNIAVVPRLLKWQEEKIRERIETLCQLLQIPTDKLDQYPAQLSGGQQQRVGVARALAADPDFLLMDEPFGALDPITREILQDEFLNIQRTLRKTVIFVTHDVDEALKLGDYIAIMKQGEIIACDTPLNLLLKPQPSYIEKFLGQNKFIKVLRLFTLQDVWNRIPQAPLIIRSEKIAAANSTTFSTSTHSICYIVDEEDHYQGYFPIHPEKRPAMSVSEIRTDMTPVYLDQSLENVLSQLLINPLESAPVLDNQRRFIGEITVSGLKAAIQNVYQTHSDSG